MQITANAMGRGIRIRLLDQCRKCNGAIGLLISMYALIKDKKDTLLIYLSMFVVICLGAFPARAVRGLTHGNVEDFRGLLELFITYPGSHFIGRVLLCVILYPVCFRLLFQKYRTLLDAVMDRYCMFLIFQHIFNRIACFYNGCCVGKYYDGIFALRYTGTGSGAGCVIRSIRQFYLNVSA